MKKTAGIIATAILSVVTAVCGFLIRDFLDSPRLRVEGARYAIPRQQCELPKEAHFRFKVAVALQDYLKGEVSDELLRDFGDGKVEYGNIANLLTVLPRREEHLTEELSFLQDQISAVQQCDPSQQDSKQTLKGVIAYANQSMFNAEIMEKLGFARPYLFEMLARSEEKPEEVIQEVEQILVGQRDFVQNEVKTVQMLIATIRDFYSKGVPPPRPLAGTDVLFFPNVRFEITISNRGKTEGQLSYVASFVPESGRYSITLIGASYKTSRPLEPFKFNDIDPHSAGPYAWVIDMLRNDIKDIQAFYDDLSSNSGLTGKFLISDIRGKTHEHKVEGLRPHN